MTTPFEIELRAYEPANVHRWRFSLTVGVPFAAGAISLDDLIAYGYGLTGDRKHIDAGVATRCQAIDWILNPQEAKGLILFARIMHGPFRFMALAHKPGILDRINVAGPWLTDALGPSRLVRS